MWTLASNFHIFNQEIGFPESKLLMQEHCPSTSLFKWASLTTEIPWWFLGKGNWNSCTVPQQDCPGCLDFLSKLTSEQ